MLNREELEQLAAIPESDRFFFSLYLPIDPVNTPRHGAATIAKNLLREELQRWEDSGQLDAATMRRLTDKGNKLVQFVSLSRDAWRRGLIIIASDEGSFLKEYDLAIPVSPRLVIDRRPAIQPLIQLFDDHEPFAAVLVDRRQARLFLVQMGEVMIYEHESSLEIDGKHKKGGWFALQQSKYARGIEKLVTIHLEEVIELLADLLKRGSANRIALGGPVEAVSQFETMLPPWMQQKVTAYLSTELFRSDQNIVEQAQVFMEQVERERENQLINEIITRVHKGDRAAVGIDDVLDSMVQGKVYRLAVTADFTQSGFSCPSCGALFVRTAAKCPYCEAVPNPVANIVELLVQQAITQGVAVEIVPAGHPQLAPMGNIAAILRY